MITPRSLAAPSPRVRLRATGVDLAAAAVWQAGLAAAGRYAPGRALLRKAFRSPATADAAQFTAGVLPVAGYLALGEAGPRRATPGKRAAGLVVEGPDGGPPGAVRIAVRTAVKLAPWQLAHLSLTRAVGIVPVRSPGTWARTGFAAALGLTAASCALAVLRADGRALHDLAAGTRVVREPAAADPAVAH